jgi:hypothetical protein
MASPCGRCGRHLAVHYQGANSTPGYHCANRTLANGRGVYCLSVGGVQIDQAVAAAFVAALATTGVKAALAEAAHVRTERRKGLRVKANLPDSGLFDQAPVTEGVV